MTQPTATASLGHIKGVAFREFAVWYGENVSENHVRAVVRALEAAHPDVFDSTRPGFGILSTRWYDARLVHAFLDRLVGPGGGDDIDRLAQSAANDIMGRTLSGVYRFLFSTFATPQLYARHANKLWSLHYDSGTTSIEPQRDGEAVALYRDWRGHHPLICKLNMSATVPIYGAMGCRNVRWVRTACVDQRDSMCAMRIHWDP